MTPYRCGASRRSRSWPTLSLARPTDVAAAQNHSPKLVLPSRSASPDITPPADPSPSTSFAEFAHLVRLEAHLVEKRRRLHARLCRGLQSSALISRFVRSGKLAHRALVDHYKLDDSTGFATLYNALHDVRNSCEAARRYAFVDPDLDVRTPGLVRAEASAPPASGFLDQLPPRIKDELLQFLSDLRTDPDFLAGRLTSLSPSELSALAPSYPPFDPAESVLASPFRARPQGSPFSRVPSAGGRSSSPVGRLLFFQRRDPLSALLHTVFAESSGPHAAEDLRRTEIWSTACARLITDGTAGGEQFMRAVLNSWAAIRDWPVKRNLELFLMFTLQDGAHLLDSAGKRTYEQGSAAPPEMAAPRPTVTADEFYSTAINGLFALIAGQPNHGGLPLGVYEIGNAIMSKLVTVKKQRAARTFMVCKWFFSSFLLDAIIYPESLIATQSHGMMAGYHISPLARQKILKEIAVRAQRHVWDVCYDWTPLHPIRSEVRQNIEVILAKFSPEASKPIVPPNHRSNSLQVAPDRTEVQPYLMLCASDISMLVDALFPERRPTSSLAGDGNNLREGFIPSPFVMSEASLSSQPPWNIHRSADLGSLPSNSGSSVLSDTVSQDRSEDAFGHQPDGMSSYTSVGSRETLLDMPPPTTVEMRGHRLRSLISQLPAYLGHDALSASSHPCAEKWAILYISHDGKSLTTTLSNFSGPGQTGSDLDALSDIGGTEPQSCNSERDAEYGYGLIREALIQLISDYEVPVDDFAEAGDEILRDRFSTFYAAPAGAGGRNLHATVRSSVRRKDERHLRGCQYVAEETAGARRAQRGHDAAGIHNGSCLLEMLDIAVADCRARLDFTMAHLYWEAGQQLRLLATTHLASEDFGSLLDHFAKGPRYHIGHLARSIENHDAWITWLQQSQSCRQSVVNDLMESIDRLRDKMWYSTDVKSSAVYEEAKNIAVALKYMGDAPKSFKSKPSIPFLPRTVPRVPTGAFLLKSQAQLVALLSAPTEHGGMAKLSDEQSEMTSHWLKQRGIENFCKGEERIHRFCLEVDRCVGKLVGQDITGAPVLWSSELYSRDRLLLDRGHQPGELDVTEWGTLVPVGCAGVGEERQAACRGNDSTYRMTSTALRWEYEQHGMGTGNWTGKNRRSVVDQFQSALPFAASPVDPRTTGKRSLTFWSPFVEEKVVSTREYARSGLHGPSTGRRPPELPPSPEKQHFLADLRETLVGLVLSDLGTMVWSRGSETDAWFCSELGEEFLRRRDARLSQPDPRFGLQEPDIIPSKQERVPPAGAAVSDAESSSTQRASAQASPPQPGAPGEQTAAGPAERQSDAASTSSDLLSPKKFPYLDSFKYLLRQFSAHPNPFMKIRALQELVSLVSLSLGSRSRPARRTHGRTSHSTNDRMHGGYLPEFGYGSQPESVARGARKSFSQGMAGPGPAFTASLDTDKVMATLQQLLRDPQSRPPTLFRDLQFISALVPGPLLDATEGGKAFWNAALAAMGLKLDICRMMVEMVDDIVAHHTRTRALPQPPSAAGAGAFSGADVQQPQPQPQLPPELVRFSMADAARMLMIPAKEGDAVAQRELATFYLTHPELLARTTLPLSRPRDTFKPQMMKQRDEDPARSDPATLCVAYHWMELSSQGGDELAQKNLRARVELNALP